MRRVIDLTILAWIPDALCVDKNGIRISFARIKICHSRLEIFVHFFFNERISSLKKALVFSLPNNKINQSYSTEKSITDTVFTQVAHVCREL